MPDYTEREGGRYTVQPITVKAAQQWIREVHRHLPVVQGGLFATSVHDQHGCVAVGLAGNPARVWQGTGRVAITRVAALQLPDVRDSKGDLHPAPACTMIYRSLCDAARALGYREIWTYTLPEEDGASLRAASFVEQGLTKAEEWDRPSRSRSAAVNALSKRRWVRTLREERIAS